MKIKFKLQSGIQNKETEDWALWQLPVDFWVRHLCDTITGSTDKAPLPWPGSRGKTRALCPALGSHDVITMMYKQARPFQSKWIPTLILDLLSLTEGLNPTIHSLGSSSKKSHLSQSLFCRKYSFPPNTHFSLTPRSELYGEQSYVWHHPCMLTDHLCLVRPPGCYLTGSPTTLWGGSSPPRHFTEGSPSAAQGRQRICTWSLNL